MTVIEQFSGETVNFDGCSVRTSVNRYTGQMGCPCIGKTDAKQFFIPNNGLVLWEMPEGEMISVTDILKNYAETLRTSLELTDSERAILDKSEKSLETLINGFVKPVNIYSRGGFVDENSQATLYFMTDTGLYFLPAAFRGDYVSISSWNFTT